jgi:TPR repeat protein/S1-C subfamily serine protease
VNRLEIIQVTLPTESPAKEWRLRVGVRIGRPRVLLVVLFLFSNPLVAQDASFLSAMGVDMKLQEASITGAPKGDRDEAMWLLKRAGQGDRAAQNNLAVKYATGDGVPKRPLIALKWFRLAADQRLGVAEFNLALMYGGTQDIPKDDQSFAVWVRKSADDGYPLAEFFQGMLLVEGAPNLPKDEIAGLAWVRKAAEQNLAPAQLTLGFAYEYGKDGLSVDKIEEFRWVSKAAQQGVPMAEMQLAEMYAAGEGIQASQTDALKWMHKAADAGSAQAQLFLGMVLSDSKDETRDPTQGFQYLLKAANQGLEAAVTRVGYAYAFGYGTPVDDKQAVIWFKKLPQPASTFLVLGTTYATGDEKQGVERDSKRAIEWLERSADEGMTYALMVIADHYRKGDWFPRDSQEAFRWDMKAAYKGDGWAQLVVGNMYEDGDGVPKDEMEAFAWYVVSSGSDTAAVGARERLENKLGEQAALAAQARSKELIADINAKKSLAGSTTAAPGSANASSQSPKASGSGTIVSTQGIVLTAAHVVSGATSIKILSVHGLKNATVLRVDDANDIAILKLETGNYEALPIEPSKNVRLGQAVATIGFPNIEIQGFSPKVTRGEISSLNGAEDDPRSWQISVPVQPGNSGGPLLDENGNLVGIVESKLSMEAARATNDIPQNVSYAIKSTYALALLEPYIGDGVPDPSLTSQPPRFEDMVAKAEQSVVLVLIY